MKEPPIGVSAAASAAAKKWSVPASVSLAQWALESGWGAHMPDGSNNPFGIKARINANGVVIDPFVGAATTEVVGGKTVHISAPFRKFSSIADAFDYHAQLLATAHVYAKAMAVHGDPVAFARTLTGVYATDPQYGEKLVALMRSNNLFQYD